MSKTCSKCSGTLDTDSVFCTFCGTPIVQTIHCPKCGGTINAVAKFCKYCAFDLSQPIQTAATTTSPLSQLATINPQASNRPSQVEPTTQSQANSNPTQTEVAADNPASFISPAGAAFAVICFFLPWLEFSACGIRKSITGAELAHQDGSLWLLPLMGIVSVAAYFICKGQKMLFKARPFIIGSSAFALCFLFYKYSSIPSGPEIFGRRITAADLGIQLQFGGFGTIIGFILAIIGCAFMSRAIVVAGQTTAATSSTSPLKYDAAFDKDRSLRLNIAAVICYLAPLLLPLGFQFVAVDLMRDVFHPIVLALIAFGLMFCLQIALLNIETYKKMPFIRFHAYQSIFLVLVYSGISLFFIGIMFLAAKDANPLQPPPLLQFIAFAAMGLGIAEWIISIFMAIKSYKREFYKLPYIGDWAMNRANKNSQPIQSTPPNQTYSAPSPPAKNYTSPIIGSPDFVPTSSTQITETASFVARHVGVNCPPQIDVKNVADKTLNLEFGGEKFVIPSRQSVVINTTDGGMFSFEAAAPGVIPLKGQRMFEGGYVYTWTLYIRTSK